MTTRRTLPLSVQQRLRSVQPRVRPSSAAQYGRQLLANRQADSRIQELIRSFGPLESSPIDGFRPTGPLNQYGYRLPDTSPEMGYTGKTDLFGNPIVADFDFPGTEDDPFVNVGGAYIRESQIPGGDPAYGDMIGYGNIDRYSGYIGAPTGGQDQPSSFGDPSFETAERNRFGALRDLAEERERQAAEAAQVEGMVNDAISALMGDIRGLEAERDKALAEAKDDIAAEFQRQIDAITNQVGELETQLADWRTSAEETQRLSAAAYDRASKVARRQYEYGAPLLDKSGEATKRDVTAGYDDSIAQLQEELSTIGADSATAATLQDSVNELRDLALSEAGQQTDMQKAILQAAEDVAVTAAGAAGATSAAQLKQIEEGFADQLTDAIKGLMDRKGELEDARTRAIEKATEAIMEQFADVGQFEGQLDYAFAVTDKAMDSWFAAAGYDELHRNQIEATFRDLLNMGLRGEDAIRQWWNAELAASEEGVPPFSEEVLEAIGVLSSVFEQSMDAWDNGIGVHVGTQTPSGGSVSSSGDRIKFSRGVGEAPNNRGNRDHPTYQARAAFMEDMNRTILSNFSVSPLGQWRDLSVSGGGQRSSNSDHYSGGALDFSGSQSELNRLFSWLQTQPWVSFAQVYTSGPAAGTLHVSGLLDGGTHHANDGHDHGEATATYTGASGGGSAATSGVGGSFTAV